MRLLVVYLILYKCPSSSPNPSLPPFPNIPTTHHLFSASSNLLKPFTLNLISIMDPSLLQRQPMSSRSADPPALLRRPCCLRCSKQLGQTPDLKCHTKATHTVCDRCATLRKRCQPVGSSFLNLALSLILVSSPRGHYALKPLIKRLR